MSALTLPLSDPTATLENVGGKGMSLAKMARARLPVPGGFHITTAAFNQFVAENGIQPRILEALESVDTANPASLESAANAIAGFFNEGKIPPAIVGAISAAYEHLESDPAAAAVAAATTVAVRSSATAEDLPGASFAGQQETYLNIRGASAVLEAVKKCWASLWTARAIAYRARQAIDPGSVALAVVVQELVCADAAGVMFTANPVTGKRDELMITAAWGLGEAIVGGNVTPDTIYIQKNAVKVTRRETNDKQVMTVRTETGTHEQPVPEYLRKSAVLSEAQAIRLAKLGMEIEQLYAMPMDIEWVLASDQFAIVQARPVTALPEAPLEWVRTNPKVLLARGSFAEFVPEPVSPLFATLALPISQDLTQRMMKDVIGLNEDSYFFEVINGYVYVGMIISPKMIWRMSVVTLAKTMQLLKTSKERWAVVRAKIQDAVSRYPQDLTTLAAPELLAGVREVFTATAEYYTVAQSGPIPAASFSELIFSRFYHSLVKRKADPAPTIFLLGYESLPLRAEKSLYDLSLWVKGQPGLAGYIQSTSAEEICASLQADPIPAPLSGEFSTRIAAHLAEFGHTLYDLDFAKPVPADDPAPVVEAMKAYLIGKGSSPYARQQAQVERREQAEPPILNRLDPLRRRWFLKLLRNAQECAPGREDCIADMGLGYPRMRKMLHELGRRLAAGGAISQPADIFWLKAQEVDTLAAALETGAALPSHFVEIERRKTHWQRMRGVTPPISIPEKSFISQFLAHDNPDGNTLKGYGASAGKVTAPACVLRGPEEFGRMRPGDVIVAVTTTPAWTPLFAMASAVVTDIGGPLSHSSIVAREYGIPAVMATGVASKRIQHGQLITVDGTGGTVTLEQDKTDITSSGSIKEPTEWKLPKGDYAALRNNIVELMASPLSPLFATLGRSAINTSFHRAMDESFGMRGIMPKEIIITVNGYAYYNGSLSAGSMARVLWNAGKIMKKMLTGAVERWTDAGRPHYLDTVSAWQSQPWQTLKNVELVDGAKQLTESAIDAYIALVSGVIPAAWMTEALFTRVYNAFVKRRGDPQAPTYLLGYDSLPIRADKSLYGLAQWARLDPALAQCLEHTPTPQLVAWWKCETAPGEITNPVWQEWRARFHEHLQKYGHTIYDLDFAHPVPADDPSPVIDTLKLYLRGQGADPTHRQRESSQRRELAQAVVEQRLKGLRLKWFIKTLESAQKYAPLREEGLAEIGLAYPLLRQMLLELGARFTKHGAIAAADEIFWLTEDEVRQAAGCLDAGLTLDSFAGAVRLRKADRQTALRVSPPVALPQMKLFGFDLMSLKSKRGRKAKGNVIKGVAASPGKITATARVLSGPEEFSLMQPGDVLVASITTPAWTPLFAMASAVVTDVGGPLSHGSIVAREYGIPAVLGTGTATRRIHSGETVTVDGAAGTVILQNHAQEN